MVARIASLAEAVAAVPDGARLGVGGILLQRKPLGLLDALARAGRRDLVLHAFLASLDAEVLAAHGAVAEAHVGYVGFEQLGAAPAFERAVAAGEVVVREHSEYTFVTGLRAALAGLPFLPTKGALGSDLVAPLGLATVRCPYTDTELLAVPAMRLDVAVLHAVAADVRGNVLGTPDRSFLFDYDANVARAADLVIVTVEEVVDTDTVRAQADRALLHAYEVDLVVPLPGGAGPTSLGPSQPPDLAALRRYLAVVADGGDPATAMSDLLAGGDRS